MLTESQVETYVTNSALNLATGSQVNSENIATQNWVATQSYMTSYIETDPSIVTWTGSTNISTVGTLTTGSWNGDPITSEYIADNTITLSDLGQNGCSDGQVLKWENDVNGWICANDNESNGSVSVSVTPIYEKWDPDAPPESPSVYDDEFDDELIDASWQNSGTGNATEINKYLRLDTNSRMVYKALPAGDFSIWTKISISGFPQFVNYGQALLGVQAGTGTLWTVGLGVESTNQVNLGVYQWTGFVSWVSTPVSINVNPTNDIYVSIRRTGTTLTFWASTDGINYNRIYTVADPGVDKMGLVKVDSSHIDIFDFFRYEASYKNFDWVPPGRVVPMGGGSSTSTSTSVITAQGDLIVGGSSGEETRLPKGNANQILQMDETGTTVTWKDPPISGGLSTYASDETTRAYTANAIWENVSGASVTFEATGGKSYLVLVTVQYRVTSGNWDHTLHRLTIDGSTTGIQPSTWDDTKSSSTDTTDVRVYTMQFVLIDPEAGQHTINLQTFDNGSSVDREYSGTFISVI